jgi:cleavage and polyadenylation specificity factor subunit 3
MHGEAKAMGSLKARLEQRYAGNEEGIRVHMPWNTETLNLTFRGDRIAKVRGTEFARVCFSHLVGNWSIG